MWYRFVDFCMHRVRMLQHFGVTPFLIFDGDYLPSKAATEADRNKRREESRRAGLDLLNAGKTSQAYLELQKAVDVSPEMARQLIDELKKSGVQYIVAPYEADAQMVYLERIGVIDGILSEDSDLLVFGAKCLLTKLDQYGNCVEINKADFCACREVSFTGWSDTEFRRMAILSGCDYLASINNMGLKTAYRMVRKHKTIEKVLRMLQFDGRYHVPKGYLEAFQQAELTFLHQRVFCPKTQNLVFHTEPEQSLDADKMPFIGAYVEPDIARGVAAGDLHPMTKLPIVVTTRNNMVSSTTLNTGYRPQPQQSTSSIDLKKGKPIDKFFKPRRVPLAELNINCLTPSPSQQEALRRNPGPWLASPVLPRPYLHRSVTEPELQLPLSAPQPTRSSTGLGVPRTSTISEPRPQKRARLCSESESALLPSTDQKIELGRSRFFSAAPEPSPSVGRVSRNKRSKKEEIHIFSDDSIEEELRNLPDFDGFTNHGPSPGKKIAVFEDTGSRSVEKQLSQIQRTDTDSTSQSMAPSLTPATSIASSAEQPTTPRDHDLPTMQTSLKDKFSFTPRDTSTSNSHCNTEATLTPAPTPSQRPSRIPLAVKSNTAAPRASVLSSTSKLTPLQRLGARATTQSKPPPTPPLTPLLTFKNNTTNRRSLLGDNSVPFPHVLNHRKDVNVEPASIPLPLPDETENMALAQEGSEDLIIHDSEGEDDAMSPGPEEGIQSAGSLNIARFVYAG